MSKYDDWLADQPEPDFIHITAPDMTDDCEDDYPVDEWFCKECKTPLGFYLSGDHGGGWNDCWRVYDNEEMFCEDCMKAAKTEVDFPVQPDCDRCGALAGDEHGASCDTGRCVNCERVGSAESAVQGDLCEACFAAMPDGVWIIAPWETR